MSVEHIWDNSLFKKQSQPLTLKKIQTKKEIIGSVSKYLLYFFEDDKYSLEYLITLLEQELYED